MAAPCAAYTPPETNPRIVLTTTDGEILVALVPESAPRHVEQLLTAIADGDLDTSRVARVSPAFYVQMVGELGTAKLSGQPVENLKVGNIRAALSVYDGGEPGQIPTLMFVLTNSPHLDTEYSTVGVVEAGMSVVEGIAETPTIGDHQPQVPITLTGIHMATQQERVKLRQAEQTALATDGTAVLAAIFIIACAAFLAAIASSFHDRLNKQRIKSLAILISLFAFFAVWVALGGTEQGSGLVGVALFGGAIGMFRLMGKFERPAHTGELGELAKPRQLADGEPHAERGVDQSKGQLELVLGQGHTPAGRSGNTAR